MSQTLNGNNKNCYRKEKVKKIKKVNTCIDISYMWLEFDAAGPEVLIMAQVMIINYHAMLIIAIINYSDRWRTH